MAKKTIEELDFKLIVNLEEFDKQVKKANEKALELNKSVSQYLSTQKLSLTDKGEIENMQKMSAALIKALEAKRQTGEISAKEYQTLKNLMNLESQRAVNSEKEAQAAEKRAAAKAREDATTANLLAKQKESLDAARKISTESQAAAAQRTALAQQRVTTEMQRTATEAQRTATAQAKAATETQKASTETRKQALLQQRASTEAARTAAAEERLRMLKESTNKQQTRHNRLLREAATLAGSYLSIWGAKKIIENIVGITAEFEKQRIALDAMLNDTQGASAIFERLKGLAVQSPFQFKELVTYAKQLSAYAIPISEIYDTTKMLADVSAGVGVGMDRLVLAYGQVRSAEFLRGQEIRQFTEAGIPLLQELAKQFSVLEGRAVSVGEVFDKVSRREVAFEMVKKVFTDMTSEGGKFYQMQEKLAQTLSGRLSNLADAWQMAMDEIGQSNSDMINAVVDGLYWMIHNYQSLLAIIKSLAAAYGMYRAAVLLTHAVSWATKIAREVTLLRQLNTELSASKALLAVFGKHTKIAGLTASATAGWVGLLVAALAGIGVGVYEWATAESEAEKTTRKMNEAIKEGIANSENATAKLDNLFWALKNATKGTQEYKKAYDQILSQYGDKLTNIDLENLKVGELTETYEKLNAAVTQEAKNSAYKAAMGVAEADAEKRKQSLLMSFYKELPDMAEAYKQEFARMIRGEISSSEVNPQAWDELSKGFEGRKALPYYYADEYNKILIDLQRQAQETQKRLDFIYGKGLKPNPTPIKEWAQAVQIVIHNASQSIKNSLKVDETTTWDAFFDKTLKRKEELQELMAKSQAVAGKGEKDNVEAYKKELEYIGQIEDGLGVIFEKEKKAETARRVDRSDDYILRYNEELRKLRTQTEDTRRQTEIASMAEGFAKQREQIRREYDNNIRLIADKQEEFRRKNFEFAEKMWKEGKRAKPVFADVELTEEQIDYISALEAKYLADRDKKLADSYTNERNQWNDYLTEYGSFLQQKKAIEDKYDTQIARTTDTAQRMRLEAQKRSALNRVELNRTTSLVDWSSISGEMKGVLAEQVRDALNALNAYVKSPEFRKVNASDQKAVYDMIAKLRGVQTEGIGNRYDEYLKDFEEKLKKYKELKQMEIDILSDANAPEAARIGISASVKKAEDDLADSAGNVQTSFDDLKRGIDMVTQGISQLNGGGLASVFNAFRNIFEGLSKAGVKGMEGITKALSGKVGGIIGAILSIIDSFAEKGIGGTFAGLFDKIGGAFQTVTNDLWGDFGKFFGSLGNMVKDIFTSAVDGIVNTVTFGAVNGLTNSNAKEVAETTKLLTDRNERLQKAIDNLTNKLDEVYGRSAISAYGEALNDARSIVENQMKLLRTQMGYHSMHHSNEYYWDLDEESYREISRVLGKRIASLEDIYKLTPEEMNRIRTSLIDVWDEMLTQGKYDKSDYWNAYADLDGKIDDLEKKLKENLLQTTFDSIRTDFVDTLMDMNASAEDFSDDFTRLLQNAILNAQIGNILDDELGDWYNRVADALKKSNGALTSQEIEMFRQEWNAIVEEGLAIRDAVANVTGYTGDTATSMADGIRSITEDTADLLASYINAIRADVSYAKVQRDEILAEIRNMASYVASPTLMDYLNHIQANTYDNARATESILADIRSMMTTDGGFTALRVYS